MASGSELELSVAVPLRVVVQVAKQVGMSLGFLRTERDDDCFDVALLGFIREVADRAGFVDLEGAGFDESELSRDLWGLPDVPERVASSCPSPHEDWYARAREAIIDAVRLVATSLAIPVKPVEYPASSRYFLVVRLVVEDGRARMSVGPIVRGLINVRGSLFNASVEEVN